MSTQPKAKAPAMIGAQKRAVYSNGFAKPVKKARNHKGIAWSYETRKAIADAAERVLNGMRVRP